MMVARLERCFWMVLLGLWLATELARAQDTIFVYDQQSSDENYLGGGVIQNVQSLQSFGQSFTPARSSIDFIRLVLQDPAFTGAGATVYLNLRQSINGPVVASTAPIYIPPYGTSGIPNYITNFFFPTAVTVTPGQVYYFDVSVQSGDPVSVYGYHTFNYVGGQIFSSGQPFSGSDLWFREGVHYVCKASPPKLNTNGTVSVTFSTAPGTTNYTQLKTNLLDAGWVNVATNVLGTNTTTWQYTDPVTNRAARYYRSVTVQ